MKMIVTPMVNGYLPMPSQYVTTREIPDDLPPDHLGEYMVDAIRRSREHPNFATLVNSAFFYHVRFEATE